MGVLDKRQVPPPSSLPRMIRIITLLFAGIMIFEIYMNRAALSELLRPRPRQQQAPASQP